MTITIQSRLVHEPAVGDGIRAFIVCSETGILKSNAVHDTTAELSVEPVQIKAGTSIDFVVDIGDVLNSDQYLWEVTISDQTTEESNVRWSSTADFPQPVAITLTAFEQLAHVLLCTNEFLFVD